MTAQIPPTPHSMAPSASNVTGRPEMTRSQTFPTPPTSASSVLGMGAGPSSYDWSSNNATSAQPLSVDTGMNHPRSMPTTPASTPPGGSLQNLQSYSGQPSYDSSKQYYSSAPAPQPPNGYTHPQRYAQPTFKSEMGPPSAPGVVSDNDHHEHKADIYASNGPVPTSGDASSHDHEGGYLAANTAAYGANRSTYAYNPTTDPSHISPEMTSSPSHQAGSGRGTPRTIPQQWQPDYQTPPRPGQSVYAASGDSRASNGIPSADSYGHTSYSSAGKRGRDEDDQDHMGRPSSRDFDGSFDPKRRKLGRAETYGGPLGSAPQMQAIKSGGGLPRQR